MPASSKTGWWLPPSLRILCAAGGRRHCALRAARLPRAHRVPVLRRARREPGRVAVEPSASMEQVKASGATRPNAPPALLGARDRAFSMPATIPLRLPTPEMLDRLIDLPGANPLAFVLTHALHDPYNFDHPHAAHMAQEARIIAQAKGHKPGPASKTIARRRSSCSSRTSPSSAISARTCCSRSTRCGRPR